MSEKYSEVKLVHNVCTGWKVPKGWQPSTEKTAIKAFLGGEHTSHNVDVLCFQELSEIIMYCLPWWGHYSRANCSGALRSFFFFLCFFLFPFFISFFLS